MDKDDHPRVIYRKKIRNHTYMFNHSRIVSKLYIYAMKCSNVIINIIHDT